MAEKIGQETPKGFVKVKEIVTRRGTVIQEFKPKKKKGGRR